MQPASPPAWAHPQATPPTIAERLAAVQARIRAAAIAAGRDGGAVTLVAVSKTHPAEAVAAAIAAGQRHFGENRVQEAVAKWAALGAAGSSTELAIIGGLQTNKAAEAVRVAQVIESLDRPRLADAIEAAAQHQGRCPRLFIQVNVGDEAQKGGVARAEADRFIEACRRRFGPLVEGLMGIPPAEGDPAPHFAWLAACAARHGLAGLSMGMSGDYETAIAHGATRVRVGTAIFGAR